MTTHFREAKRLIALFLLVICLIITTVSAMELFQAKLIEYENSRLIATSNYNYAITSPKLAAKNWRTVSVNGDKVFLTLLDGEQEVTSRGTLGEAVMMFIEDLRDEIANSNGGYSHVSSSSSGPGSIGSSFMVNSGMSSSSSYSTSGQQTSSLFGGGNMSYNMKDPNNFSVSRSDFPFSWSRVFINGDLVTLISKNGDVRMMPISSLEPDQFEAINRVKSELIEVQQAQSQHISNTMQQSVDMVSNVFNSIMSSFPKPPNYQNAVGSMFGNNFPFGSNNSPFSASSGWPFSAAGGAGAVAIAGRRR